jgi:hypothetical protein
VIDDHVLVAKRNQALIVDQLEMQCDTREVPAPLDENERSEELWIIGSATFGGATDVENDPTPNEQKYAKLQGMAAISLCGARLLGIVAPNAAS